jgi:hypothetical protein
MGKVSVSCEELANALGDTYSQGALEEARDKLSPLVEELPCEWQEYMLNHRYELSLGRAYGTPGPQPNIFILSASSHGP